MVPALAAGEPTGNTPGIYAVTETKSTVTPKDENGNPVTGKDGFFANAVQVTVKVTADPATYYLILALNDGTKTPTKDNIAYIDQKGEATFNVYPSELSDGKTYDIYLSSDKSALTSVASFKYYEPKAVPSVMLGDVDKDKSLSGQDALWTLQASVGKRGLDADQLLAAEVDHEEGLSAQDALFILQASVGKRVLE